MNTGNLDGLGIAELRNYKIQNLASAPTTNVTKGRFYFNTTDNTLYVYDGTAWINALSQGGYIFLNGLEVVSGTSNVQIKIATGGDAGNVTLTADSNGLKADVTKLSVDSGSADYLTIANDEISANVDTIVSANSDKLITSGAVNTAINNAIAGGVIYKGVWTVTGETDYSAIPFPVKAGWEYEVSGSAQITLGGVTIDWNSGDYIRFKNDVASSAVLTNSDFNKIDNTESSDTVKLNATQTLTNKTIDADDNTISDLTTSNLKSGVLQTTVRRVSSASDLSIPSEKAVASALAGRVYTEQNGALTQSGGACTWTVTHNLNNSNVIVGVYKVSDGEKVAYDTAITSVNAVTITILSALNISADTYKAVVMG